MHTRAFGCAVRQTGGIIGCRPAPGQFHDQNGGKQAWPRSAPVSCAAAALRSGQSHWGGHGPPVFGADSLFPAGFGLACFQPGRRPGGIGLCIREPFAAGASPGHASGFELRQRAGRLRRHELPGTGTGTRAYPPRWGRSTLDGNGNRLARIQGRPMDFPSRAGDGRGIQEQSIRRGRFSAAVSRQPVARRRFAAGPVAGGHGGRYRAPARRSLAGRRAIRAGTVWQPGHGPRRRIMDRGRTRPGAPGGSGAEPESENAVG